jgi:hypothetical protein
VVEGHHAAVVVGVAVGADAEQLRHGSGQAEQEAAGGAEVGRGLGDRGAWTAVTVVPALRGEVAALQGERADPAEAEVAGHLADLGLLVGVERVVAERVGRHQPRVVLLDGHQVARRQIARLHALLVGDPLRGHDRLGAGDEHDLIDRDGLLA